MCCLPTYVTRSVVFIYCILKSSFCELKDMSHNTLDIS